MAAGYSEFLKGYGLLEPEYDAPGLFIDQHSFLDGATPNSTATRFRTANPHRLF